MSELAPNSLPEEQFEASLIQSARTFPYPPAPDVTRAVTRRLAARQPHGGLRRGLVLAGVTLVFILAVIFAVPPVRAAVLEWIRLGAVRIFLVQPTPTPVPRATLPVFITTDEPVPTPLRSVLDLSGETTLAKIQAENPFKVSLPAFPPNLGLPDHVYYQQEGWPVVVLAWLDPANPQSARMVLSETNAESIVFQKMPVETYQYTQVSGKEALWVGGPYMLVTGSGDMAQARLIENSHTLIWTVGAMTYRLETSEDLDKAVRIAESIK